MAEPDILYAVDNGVATLTLNRPAVRNAFGDDTRTPYKFAPAQDVQAGGPFE